MTQIPLAELMRPQTLDEYIGQTHLMAKDNVFRQLIEQGAVHSMIFWGPPGVGKTTLALLIAKQTNRAFYTLSAVNSGVKDVREVIEKASTNNTQPILFIDEIHRFSKSQQDSLLGAVEKGTVILIGATTENPSFEVISPLLSRCQVYILQALSENELLTISQNALQKLNSELGKNYSLAESEALLRVSGGDARKLLNALDIIVQSLEKTSNSLEINNENTLKIIQQNIAIYDKSGEMHYDIVSAFIKSMRGSDPNASVYWLARMIEAGEDPLFIARRMLILASEDIGNANPTALIIANNCFDAVNKIGFPESRIILSQTAIYLACSPKSNASYLAIEQALEIAKREGNQAVPLWLRNAPTNFMKNIGYGANYKYAHQFENNFVNQEFMPETLSGIKLYDPGKNTRENELRDRLRKLWGNKYNY